jgi:hypothetical protein
MLPPSPELGADWGRTWGRGKLGGYSEDSGSSAMEWRAG